MTRPNLRSMDTWKGWAGWIGLTLFLVGLAAVTVPLLHAIDASQKTQAAKDKVWNEVSYPQGNIGTVLPDEVHPGETVYVTFKEFCNLGVDVHITRWLDFLGADGKPYGSFGLVPLEFYGAKFIDAKTPGTEPGCVKNQTQPVGLPAEIAGRPPGDSTVRFRTVTTYVKPEQVINVPAYSESFILLEQK